jgi:hypothetical protein
MTGTIIKIMGNKASCCVIRTPDRTEFFAHKQTAQNLN